MIYLSFAVHVEESKNIDDEIYMPINLFEYKNKR
jgi:hypothetical protein